MTHVGHGEAPYTPARCDLFGDDWVDALNEMAENSTENLLPPGTAFGGTTPPVSPWSREERINLLKDTVFKPYMDSNPEPAATRAVDAVGGAEPVSEPKASYESMDIYDLQDALARYEQAPATPEGMIEMGKIREYINRKMGNRDG